MPRRIESDPRQDFKRLPALRPEDLEGSDVAVVTVEEAQDQIPVTKPGGQQKMALRMRFAEFPEHNFWPNATSRGYLQVKLGRDSRRWKGQTVVLEVVEVEDPNKGDYVLSLWVAPPKMWPGYLREHKAQAAESAAPADLSERPAALDARDADDPEA